jgi:2-phosphosulfolactate phosphatase
MSSSATFPSIELPGRPARPRHSGLTMVLDKSLGLHAASDLVATAATAIDIVKLGWGSALLYPEAILRQKIALYTAAGIQVCTGGTLAEIAHDRGRYQEMLAEAAALGFTAIEISNGVNSEIDRRQKGAMIAAAVAQGLVAYSEVGRKFPEEDRLLTYRDRVNEVRDDLAAGAGKVVMEARESGTVGIFNADGKVNSELAHELFQYIDPNDIIWEAPRKEQQIWLMRQLGPEVNIGNIAPDEALSVESLRLGVRADTFRDHRRAATTVYLELGVGGALRARRRGDLVVVVDALRASATIIQALQEGAREVVPVVSADELEGEVTIGERGGNRLPNADYGNSPHELIGKPLAGRQVVLSSTNGAECICTASDGNPVLIGTMLNATAVAGAALRIANAEGRNITLLAAGRNNLPAVEDRIAVTEILKQIPNPIVRGILEPCYSSHPERDFLASDSGINLVTLGYAQDVIYCAALNRTQLVPIYDGNRIVRLEG